MIDRRALNIDYNRLKALEMTHLQGSEGSPDWGFVLRSNPLATCCGGVEQWAMILS